MELLTEKLRALATDGNKHRAKVDKRKQRSVFRDVLRAVEVILLSYFECLDCNHVVFNLMKMLLLLNRITVSVKETGKKYFKEMRFQILITYLKFQLF